MKEIPTEYKKLRLRHTGYICEPERVKVRRCLLQKWNKLMGLNDNTFVDALPTAMEISVSKENFVLTNETYYTLNKQIFPSTKS